MASAVQKSVKEATEELHAEKASEGVEINGVEGDRRERGMDDIENDMKDLDEPPRKSIFSKIKSFLGRSSSDEVSAEPVEHNVPDIDFGSHSTEQEEDVVDAPEEIGSHESLDSLKPGEDLETGTEAEPGFEDTEPLDKGVGAEETDFEDDSGPLDTGTEEEGHGSPALDDEPTGMEGEAGITEESGVVEDVDETGIEPGESEVEVEEETAGTEPGDIDSAEDEEREDIFEAGDELPRIDIDIEEPQHEEIDTGDTGQEETGELEELEENLQASRDEESSTETPAGSSVTETSTEPATGDIRKELRELEEKVVEEESRELSKIKELEQRIERLEMRDERALENRMEELEDRLESIKTPKQLDDRLTELENEIIDAGHDTGEPAGQEGHQDDQVETEVEGLGARQEDMEQSIEELREEVEDLRSDIRGLEQREAGPDVQEIEDEVERLWEAMDNELAQLEDGIYDNQKEVEDLMRTVLELSELVKKAMNQ